MSIVETVLKKVQKLSPEQQRAVLEFTEFLEHKNRLSTEDQSVAEPMEGDSSVDLIEWGIDTAQATDLRARLQAFAGDWNRPEMAVYDEI